MKHYVSFSQLVLSLGTQRILDSVGTPIFDVITARGVSMLALIHTPTDCELPSIIVCGDTNNITKLSDAVENTIDGRKCNTYLVRMTAAACITPTAAEEESAHYDAVAATGLVSAARKTLQWPIEILSVSSCDRQVTQFGQSHWFTLPSQGQEQRHPLSPRGSTLKLGTSRPYDSPIAIQIGAGGGGLTLGPSQSAKT